MIFFASSCRARSAGGLIDVEEDNHCVAGNEGVSLRDQREIFHGQGALQLVVVLG